MDADNVYVNDKVVTSENVHEGDIIVVVRNGSRALIGKHAQIKASMPNTVIGAFMSGMRSEHSSFVNALLDTSAFENEIAKNMGATINQITGYMFSKMEFMIPSGDEQQKIGEYFQSLDHLITLHQRILRKIVEKQAFVWEQRKLDDIVEFLDTMRKPLEGAKRVSGPYPYYGASGIVDYVDGYLFDEELILLSEDGANITDRNYPVCFLASGKYWVNNHAHVLRSKQENENNFICISLERKDYTQYNTGMAMPKLNKETCRKIPVLCPTFEEQQKIGDYFRSLDNLITLHHRKHVKIQKDVINDWEQRKLGSLLEETRNKTTVEDEDTLLSCAIDGMYLNSELFSHFRGSSNIGYLKIRKNDLILSAQNLHLGNCNVNLRFEHGIISPAYKVYELVGCNPLFMQAWVKKDSTKDFFLKASTEGASVCRKNIVWGELYKQELPIPNIEEQTKVGEYFNSLDHLITLHHRKHVKIQKDVINDWEQRKLKTVATFSKGSGYSKGDLQEDGTPIILYGRLYTKYETIISEVDTFVSEKSGSVHSQGGEVIIPASGETAEDIARASTVENKGVLLGGDLNIVIPNEDIDSAFLALSISNGAAHRELASKAQGKSVVHIHNAEIQALNIAFPSKPEQSRISVYFSNLDHLITLHQHKQKYLKKH